MKSRIKWYFLRKRTLFSYRISDISVVSSQNQRNARQHRGSYARRFAASKSEIGRPGGSTATVDQCDVIMRHTDCRGTHRRQKKSVRQLRDAPFVRAACSRLQGEPEIFELPRGKASAQVPRVRVMLRLFSLLTRRCTISPPSYMPEWCVKLCPESILY